MKALGKQAKYLGLNQIEGLETLLDTRVLKEQRRNLYRSPQQLRGSYLLKLGIPPSPQISINRGRLKDISMTSTSSAPKVKNLYATNTSLDSGDEENGLRSKPKMYNGKVIPNEV